MDGLVRVQQAVVVAVGVGRSVREGGGRHLAGIRVGVGDRRRDRTRVGRAAHEVALVVGVLLPRAARPRGARPLPVVRVGVGDARAVRVLLRRVEPARRIELPLRLVPGRAAVAGRPAPRLVPFRVVAEAERIGVAAGRGRASKGIVRGLGHVAEGVRPPRLAVQRVILRERLRNPAVHEVRRLPHHVRRRIVIHAVDPVRDARRAVRKHDCGVAPESVVGHLPSPFKRRLLQGKAVHRDDRVRRPALRLRDLRPQAGRGVVGSLVDRHAPGCRLGHRAGLQCV